MGKNARFQKLKAPGAASNRIWPPAVIPKWDLPCMDPHGRIKLKVGSIKLKVGLQISGMLCWTERVGLALVALGPWAVGGVSGLESGSYLTPRWILQRVLELKNLIRSCRHRLAAKHETSYVCMHRCMYVYICIYTHTSLYMYISI